MKQNDPSLKCVQYVQEKKTATLVYAFHDKIAKSLSI